MIIGFAGRDTLNRKDSDFELFKGTVTSTLTAADEALMEHHRDATLAPRPTPAIVAPTAPKLSHPSRKRSADQVSVSSIASASTLARRQRNAPPPELNLYNSLPAAVQYKIVTAEFATTVKELTKARICMTCNAPFDHVGSTARRECRWHPGTLGNVTNPHTGRLVYGWTCCNMPYREAAFVLKSGPVAAETLSGCCLCDHTDVAYSRCAPNSTTLPITLVTQLGIHQRGSAVLPVMIDDHLTVQEALRLTCTIMRATYTRVENIPRGFYSPLGHLRNECEVTRDRYRAVPLDDTTVVMRGVIGV